MGQQRRMSEPAPDQWTLVFPDDLWHQLQAHLFPGDGEEHGAVVLAGAATGRRGLRLLAREVIFAEDGVDYVPGTRGHRALSPLFIAKVARRAQSAGWAYLAAHCHGGTDHVAFSRTDLESHERGYPALRQLTGRPVGGLVFARNAAAGDLWTLSGERVGLKAVTIIGDNVVTVTSRRRDGRPVRDTFDRQARLLGAEGQRSLEGLRVAVVGLGGAGSMAAEMLVRLGVGELVYIDPDRIDPTNISRVVGSAVIDTNPPTARSGMAARGPRLKVEIAADHARRSGLSTRIEIHASDVAEPGAVRALKDCDWIVLAADSQIARHIVNAVAHAYLIPVIQVGVKVPVDAQTGTVGDIFCVARHITPTTGCLWCNGLIDPTELQLEATGEDGMRARAYVGPDAPAPSVITLNGVAISLGMTELLLSTVGLITRTAPRSHSAGYQRYLPGSHRYWMDEPRRDPACIHCGRTDVSLFARGDDAVLPTRWTSPAAPSPPGVHE